MEYSKLNDRKENIQPKLSVGQPNDKFEKEADNVADKVMQKSNSNFEIQRKKIDEPISPLVSESSPQMIQMQPQVVYFPTLTVHPVVENGAQIKAVRISFAGVNQNNLQTTFPGVGTTNQNDISTDVNFADFTNNVSIISQKGGQLYFEYLEGNVLKRVPVRNPNSQVPDGIFGQREETIWIGLSSPITIVND